MRRLSRTVITSLVVCIVLSVFNVNSHVVLCANSDKKLSVFDSAEGNLCGNTNKQIIQLVGKYEDEYKTHSESFNIKIIDKASGKILLNKCLWDGKGGGSGVPELYIRDFNGDKRSEIFIRVPSGGNLVYYYYYMYTFYKNKLKSVSVNDLVSINRIDIKIQKNKIKIYSKDLHKTLVIPIDKDIVNSYKQKKVKLIPSNLCYASTLTPVYWDKDRIAEIKDVIYFMKYDVKGLIGEYRIVYKYVKGQWRVVELKLTNEP